MYEKLVHYEIIVHQNKYGGEVVLTTDEAKELFSEELEEYGLEKIIFNEGKSYHGNVLQKRWLSIFVPEKGNQLAINFLLAQGWVKERRVSENRSFGVYHNHEPHRYIIQLKFEVSN